MDDDKIMELGNIEDVDGLQEYCKSIGEDKKCSTLIQLFKDRRLDIVGNRFLIYKCLYDSEMYNLVKSIIEKNSPGMRLAIQSFELDALDEFYGTNKKCKQSEGCIIAGSYYLGKKRSRKTKRKGLTNAGKRNKKNKSKKNLPKK